MWLRLTSLARAIDIIYFIISSGIICFFTPLNQHSNIAIEQNHHLDAILPRKNNYGDSPWLRFDLLESVGNSSEKNMKKSPPSPPQAPYGSRGGLIGIAKMSAPCLRNGSMKSLASKALEGSWGSMVVMGSMGGDVITPQGFSIRFLEVKFPNRTVQRDIRPKRIGRFSTWRLHPS